MTTAVPATTDPKATPGPRLVGLDLLRLVAVLLVLGAHFREVLSEGEA